MEGKRYKVFNPILKSKRFKFIEKRDQSLNNTGGSSYREYENISSRLLKQDKYNSVFEAGKSCFILYFELVTENSQRIFV